MTGKLGLGAGPRPVPGRKHGHLLRGTGPDVFPAVRIASLFDEGPFERVHFTGGFTLSENTAPGTSCLRVSQKVRWTPKSGHQLAKLSL
jgi:hypothetical protein